MDSQQHNKRVTALVMTRDALWSAGSTNGLILLHSLQTMKLLRKLYFPGKGSDSDFVTALVPIQRAVWAGSSDGSLVLFDEETKVPSEVPSLHSQAIYCIAPGDGCVMAGSADGVVSVYTPSTSGRWQGAGSLRHHHAAVRAIMMAPGGRVWTAGDDHLIVVADLRSGSVLVRISDAAGPVLSLAMAGEYVWSGSADRHIRCHHLQSGRTVRELSAHQGWVTSLAATSTTLWSGSTDRSVREWDVITGHPVSEALEVPGHAKLVWCVAALPDDSLLAVGLGDGRVLMLQRNSSGLAVCEGIAAASSNAARASKNPMRSTSLESKSREIEIVSLNVTQGQPQVSGGQTPETQQRTAEDQLRQQQLAHKEFLKQQELDKTLAAQRNQLEKEHQQVLASQTELERQTRELQAERQRREEQMKAASDLESRLRALMGERAQFRGIVGTLKSQLTEITSGLEQIREDATNSSANQSVADEVDLSRASATNHRPAFVVNNGGNAVSSPSFARSELHHDAPSVSDAPALQPHHLLAPSTSASSIPLSNRSPATLSPAETLRTSSLQHRSHPVSASGTLNRTASSTIHHGPNSSSYDPVAPASQIASPTLRGWTTMAPAQVTEPLLPDPMLIDPSDENALLKIEAIRRELDRQFQETQRAAQIIKHSTPLM